jgi:hypothetical protein
LRFPHTLSLAANCTITCRYSLGNSLKGVPNHSEWRFTENATSQALAGRFANIVDRQGCWQ